MQGGGVIEIDSDQVSGRVICDIRNCNAGIGKGDDIFPVDSVVDREGIWRWLQVHGSRVTVIILGYINESKGERGQETLRRVRLC